MDSSAAAATVRRPISQDYVHEVRYRQDKKKEIMNHQGSNDTRVPREWARPGRVFDRNTNRGGYSRSSLPGVSQEFRVVKDNRTKQKADVVTVSESLHNGDSSNEQTISNVEDKSSTETLTAQSRLATQNSNGHGAIQADNGRTAAAQAHFNEVKSSSDQRSGGAGTIVAGSHADAVLEKGSQNRVLPVMSGSNNFAGELCCSPSDPIHVPSPGSRSAGTFGAIRRQVGVVGSRQQSSDCAATNTSTSNGLVIGTSDTKDNASHEHQSGSPSVMSKNTRFNLPVAVSNRSFSSNQHYSKSQLHQVSHPKVTPHLEWKPKSIQNSSSVNHAVNVACSSAPSCVDDNQMEVTGLSEKLAQTNVLEDMNVIIPEHLMVPESERTHLIFGSFESDVDSSKDFTSAPDTVVTKEDLNDQPTISVITSSSARSSDNNPADGQIDFVDSHARPQQPDSVVSAVGHQQSLTGKKEVPAPDVITDYGTNEMISNNVTHSSPQLQHQDNSTFQNFEAYEPDSRYDMPFITEAVGDGETSQTMAYPSEIMGLHPANVNQLSVSAAAQQSVTQMYHQQVQVPQYPNFLPYRHVFPPFYVPPMAVPNYSSNPAFAQLPHASSYLVMPNGTSQLAANGMKYGPSHQYKQVFPGSTAGYGTYPNQNGYPISSGAIGSTGTIEDVNRSKYKDNNLYSPNPLGETTDLWIQTPRDIPNIQSTPYFNLMGQAVSPHTAYLPAHNGHTPFSPAPQPSHLQYPGLPHTLQPASMTMVQNPQAMVHQPVPPQLASNMGVEVGALAPGAQVGAFQQNQLGHLGWTPNF